MSAYHGETDIYAANPKFWQDILFDVVNSYSSLWLPLSVCSGIQSGMYATNMMCRCGVQLHSEPVG